MMRDLMLILIGINIGIGICYVAQFFGYVLEPHEDGIFKKKGATP